MKFKILGPFEQFKFYTPISLRVEKWYYPECARYNLYNKLHSYINKNNDVYIAFPYPVVNDLKVYKTMEEAMFAIDNKLIEDGFILCNSQEEINKYKILL